MHCIFDNRKSKKELASTCIFTPVVHRHGGFRSCLKQQLHSPCRLRWLLCTRG